MTTTTSLFKEELLVQSDNSNSNGLCPKRECIAQLLQSIRGKSKTRKHASFGLDWNQELENLLKSHFLLLPASLLDFLFHSLHALSLYHLLHLATPAILSLHLDPTLQERKLQWPSLNQGSYHGDRDTECQPYSEHPCSVDGRESCMGICNKLSW